MWKRFTPGFIQITLGFVVGLWLGGVSAHRLVEENHLLRAKFAKFNPIPITVDEGILKADLFPVTLFEHPENAEPKQLFCAEGQKSEKPNDFELLGVVGNGTIESGLRHLHLVHVELLPEH